MSGTRRLLRTGALTGGWLLVVPVAVLLLSAIVPVVPWLRIYAFAVVPDRTPWFLLFSLAASGIGAVAHARRPTRNTRALLIVACACTLAAGGVLARFLSVAWRNGVRIDLLAALSTRQFSEGAVPDESHVYAAPGGEPLWVDIYRPRQRDRVGPALMFVHGGGFVEGSRRVSAANLRSYAELGWTVLSIDYRLARVGRPTWNLAAADVRCALAWTAVQADRLRIDTDRLALNGASAGGSLVIAAAYATAEGSPDPACGPRVPRVRAVVARAPLIDARGSWYNPGEFQALQRSYMSRYLGGSPEQYPERYAAVDARRHIVRSMPPTLLLAGRDDPLLPVAAIEDFARRLRAADNRSRLIVFPYSGHDFNTTFDSVNNQTVRQVIVRFLTENGAGPVPEQHPSR